MPLFGRERELEVLRSAVARRTGALIRLCGEPGIGKTSLASAIFEGARESGLRVGWARAWRGAPAFDAFRSALGVAPMAGPSREATFEAIRRELEARGHVLVVLDDIHEADSDSLDLLAWLAPQLRMMTALMIVTERSSSTGADAGTTSKLAKLARHATTIELGPLSPAAVGELIAQSSGIAADARLVEAVHRGTSGNALFVDGVVRAAVRDGTLTSGTIRFPRDVEQAIAERINDAGEGIADALRVCAILARPFTSSIVANVLSRAQLEVADLLRRACDENLIVEKDATFTFRHPLVAEAIAGSLEASTRTELHAAVARAIGDAASPSELAYHHAHAVPTVPVAVAIASCRRAAEAAAENTAHEEEVRFRTLVVSLLGNAREASAELELGRAIFRAGRNDDARATFARAASLARDTDPALYCEIALAFADTGEFGAIDAPKLALLRDAVGFAETQSPSVGIRIRSRLGAELWMGSATRAEADELTRNAIADARALGDDDVLFTALDCRFQALWGPGTLEERIALAGELGERARRALGRDEEQAPTRAETIVEPIFGPRRPATSSRSLRSRLPPMPRRF